MSQEAHLTPGSLLPSRFRQLVRFTIAPLALAFIGFHITDFVLSGVYSWPRASRILVLFLAMTILSYEFVYKEHRANVKSDSRYVGLKVVFSSCVIPFMMGSLALVVLLAFSD